VALAVLAPAASTAAIYTGALFVDRVLAPHDLDALVRSGAPVAALALLAVVLAHAGAVVLAGVRARFARDVRVGVFAHVQALGLDVLESRRVGDLPARLTGDVAALETLLVSVRAVVSAHVARIVLAGGALVLLSPPLALVVLAGAALLWVAGRHGARAVDRAGRAHRRSVEAVGAVAGESVGHAAVVRAYDRQASQAAHLRRQSDAACRAERRAASVGALASASSRVVETLSGIAAAVLGAYALSRGALTLGELAACLLFAAQLAAAVHALSRLRGTLAAARPGGERLTALLDRAPAIRSRTAARRLPAARGEICFDAVSFRDPSGSGHGFDDVSFRAAPGETVAILAPGGTGTSVVTKLLLGFQEPAAGTVRLDGHDVRELAVADLRRHVTLLLQDTLVFDGTIRENIVCRRANAAHGEVVAAARAAGADEFITRLPDGYCTVVGRSSGVRLSREQRQRIAIARALVRDTPVVVLDEPTTGLEADAAARMLEPLRRLMEGRTSIVVAHDVLATRLADRIVVVADGRVVETGTHAKLLERRGPYARLWRLHRPAAGRVAEALWGAAA
jgi:ATP-binding cassette subfamily B protein